MFEVADDRLRAALDETLPQVAQAIERDDLTAAAQVFSRVITNDDELASLAASDYLHEAGQYMPVFLRELEHDAASDAPGPTDPSRLTQISAPTLLMHGSRTELHDWFDLPPATRRS